MADYLLECVQTSTDDTQVSSDIIGARPFGLAHWVQTLFPARSQERGTNPCQHERDGDGSMFEDECE